jgi:hypothetical protein
MLLGDFNFLSMQDGDMYMGPILFVIFVSIAVFVVLMILVAIISQQYEDTKRAMESSSDFGSLLQPFAIAPVCCSIFSCSNPKPQKLENTVDFTYTSA